MWKNRASLTSPWALFVIKTLSKFLAGEWGWRCQNLTKKCMVMMWSWKRSKTSWIGHEAWMGIAWGNMEDGRMGLKHSYVTCFGGSGGLGIENVLGHLLKRDMFQWVVGFKVQVLRLMSCGVQFSTGWNECWDATEIWHVFVLVTPKPMLLVYGNPCQDALKWVMHLRLVAEITLGDFRWGSKVQGPMN